MTENYVRTAAFMYVRRTGQQDVKGAGYLDYDPTNPYAVTLGLPDGEVVTLLRTVLAAGRHKYMRPDDSPISVHPEHRHPDWTVVDHNVPGNWFQVALMAKRVDAFVAASLAMVPLGSEGDEVDTSDEAFELFRQDCLRRAA